MKNRIKFFLLLAGMAIFPLFSHEAEIEIKGDNTYKAVRLTPQIYNMAHRNLSDLLIKDPDGENVPYFINSSLKKTETSRETYSMRLINSYTKDEYFFFDYRLLYQRSSDTIATSIEFTTRNTGFAKQVDVFGSYDNIYWEFVQRDNLYVVDSKSKLEIEFSRPQKYTHYRFRLANNQERISFLTVNLVYNLELSEETYFIESFTPDFSVESEDRITKINVEGLKNLRLCDITIETDSMFIRNVRALRGSRTIEKELYNLSINGESYMDTTLPLNREISADEVFTVSVIDADDKPINIKSVIVRYYADDIVFAAGGQEIFTLEFGVNMTGTAPVYDIKRYMNEIIKGPVDRLELSSLTFADAPERKVLTFNKIVFNAVVIIIALMLGVLILLKLKRSKS